MFGSAVLEVVIGLILVFLLVSLICTSVKESIEAFMKDRAEVLERTIRTLLEDPTGDKKAKEFFEHGLIFPLYSGTYKPDQLKTRTLISQPASNLKAPTWSARAWQGVQLKSQPAPRPVAAQDLKMKDRSGLPSYIPARSFALAILDISAKDGAGPDRLAAIRESIEKLPPQLGSVLRSALDSAEGDIEHVREAIENWYDSAMDRVSGWYKRRAQLIVFFIAFGIAATLNIDALTIANKLSTNADMRAMVVKEAEAINDKQQQLSVETREALESRLNKLSLPIGWTQPPLGRPECPKNALVCWSPSELQFAIRETPCLAQDDAVQCKLKEQQQQKDCADYRKLSRAEKARNPDPCPDWQKPVGAPVLIAADFAGMGVGWLITALAAMLGAPFWFDLLNKFMVIRSTVKPHEKSPEEGSEDRQGKQIVVNVPPPPAADRKADQDHGEGDADPPPPPPRPPEPFVPHTWVGGTQLKTGEDVI